MAMLWAAVVSSSPAPIPLCRASPSVSCMTSRSTLSKRYASLSWSSSIALVPIFSQRLCRGPSLLVPKQKAAWTRRAKSEAAKRPNTKSSSSNSKDLRNTLPSLVDDDACRTIGQLIAERSKNADVFSVAYEPKKNERIEGKLAIVLDTIKDNGIIFL